MSLPFARFFEGMVGLSPSRPRQRCVFCQFSFTQKRSCAAVQTALETVCSSALSLRFQPFGSSKTPFPSPQSVALGLQVHMDWAVKAGGLRCKRPALVSEQVADSDIGRTPQWFVHGLGQILVQKQRSTFVGKYDRYTG